MVIKSTKALEAKIQAVSPVSKLAPSWPNAIEGRSVNDSKAIARGFFRMGMVVLREVLQEVELGGAEQAGGILIVRNVEINGKCSNSVA